MNPLQRRSFLGISLGLFGTKSLLTESTVAAAPPAAGAPTPVKEKLIEFKKHEIAAQKAPDFNLKGGTTDKRFKAKDWLELEFEVDVKAPKGSPRELKFLDNVQIKFYAFLTPADATKKKVLVADVTYINVPIDDSAHVVVYLSPATLLNLTGDKIVNKAMISHMGAEATYNGATVGFFSSAGAPPPAPGKMGWWTNPAAPPAEAGRLLPKHKTPFAPLWYDYYLEEKTDK
jgi:hypothetical protein